MKMMGKWQISRNLVRLAMILLILSPAMGFAFFYGNFSSGLLFGQLHLTDPLAFFQMLLASPAEMTLGFLVSALIILVLYVLLGRVFCSWICPLGAVLEWIAKLRVIPSRQQNSSAGKFQIKYQILGLLLLISLLGSLPIFLLFSPMAMFERILMFGLSLSLIFIICILSLDIILGKGFWCHNTCPLGAFYSLVGRWRVLGLNIDEGSCNGCGTCWEECPVGEEVIKPAIKNQDPNLVHADCTNCGDCIDNCPQDALRFGFRIEKGMPLGKTSWEPES